MKFRRYSTMVACFILVLFCSSAALTFAQDDVTQLVERYADIPQSRTEDGAFVLGDPDAPITIIVFEDFLCPHCQTYEETTIQPLISEYVETGQAQLEFRFFPVIHPDYSLLLARLTECADTVEEGLFWPARDILFQLASTEQITADVASTLAEQLDISKSRLSSCADEASQVETDFQYGQDLGVMGTPAVQIRYGDDEPTWITIGGVTYDRGSVPFEVLEAVITGDEDFELATPEVAIPSLLDETLLHDENLLSDEECTAPCWRGITPGETDWNEALTILEDDPDFTDPQVQESPDNPLIRQAAWQEIDGAPCCQMLTDNGETVSAVFLRLAPTFTLGEVIEVYGEPAYVLGIPYTDDEAIINLIFPDIQTVIYAFVAGTETGELSERSEIIAALFMTEKDMALLTTTNNLHAWEGYQSYQDYERGEFEVTPSVTLTPTP
jgi:protein-disulfide isomerase